ncbi:MAG: AraC family transcriptional regulator [Pseudomonadota bacterium]
MNHFAPRAMNATPAPAFHPAYAKLLHALLGAQGADADGALAKAGLSAARLQGDERFIEQHQMRALIEAAQLASRCPWLGLEFGMMAQVFMHGPVGYAAVASASLRQAIDVLARFSSLRSTAVRFELHAGRRSTALHIVELGDIGGAARQVLLEAVLTIIARLMQNLVGRSCAEVGYFLPWPAPPWQARYGQCLGGVCHFDAPQLALRLPAHLLDLPCLSADPEAFAAAYQDCERKLDAAQAATPVSERVRARLLRAEGRAPTLAALAVELAMSPRTLMRQLKAEGCCYQEILDQMRFERARWYLLHTGSPMEAIAERLGMQDTSNFSRSFRRWSGMSPSAFRRAKVN